MHAYTSTHEHHQLTNHHHRRNVRGLYDTIADLDDVRRLENRTTYAEGEV